MSCAVGSRQATPFLDVAEPVDSWTPSWSLPTHSSFYGSSKKIVFALHMTVVSEFSLLDIFEQISFNVELC